MFVKVFNTVNFYLEKNIDSLSFISNEYGCITIENDHENIRFKLNACKLILKINEEEQKLYVGYGFISVKDGNVFVSGFPVSDTLEDFKITCAKMSEYGKECLENFENTLEIYYNSDK